MTELGEVVNNIMKQAFPSIVDTAFTANMEYLLDRIGDGTVPWKTVIENFYPDLEEAVTEAEKKLEAVKIADEVSDVPCDLCGRMMVIKYGPHGKFLACPGFPECRNTKPYLEKIGVVSEVRKRAGDPENEEGTKILWVRRQPELRIYVLAEAIHEEVSEVWKPYGRKGK